MSLGEVPAPFEPREPLTRLEGRAISGDRVAELVATLPPMELPADGATALRASVLPPEDGDDALPAFPPVSATRPEGPSEPGPFRVTGCDPVGDVLRAPHLTLRFSRPVASGDTATPAILKPAVPGRWRWLGSRVLQFHPDEALPMATPFTVGIPAGVEAQDGESLAEPAQFAFTTAPPGVVAWHPGKAANSPRPVIVVAFDQRVDGRELLPFVRLAAVTGLDIPLELASNAEVHADWYASRVAEQAGPGQWLAVRPRHPLPQAAGYRITVAAGAPSAEGPLPTAADQSTTFVAPRPLRVVDHRCFPDGSCPPGDPLLIELNNPLDTTVFDGDTLFVDPPAPGMTVQARGPTIAVEGLSEPRHVITLPATLTDVYGQPLGVQYPIQYEVGGAAAADPGGADDAQTNAPYVTVHGSAESLTVWVTSPATGAPLAGAAVAAQPDGASGATDERGLVVLPLGEEPVQFVEVSGADGAVAVAPAPSRAGWQRAQRHETLRWYVAPAVAVPRATGDVAIKGWIRRVGVDGVVRELGESPRRVAWQILDPQGDVHDEGLAELGLYGGFDLKAALPRTRYGPEARLLLKAVGAPDVGGTTHEHRIPLYPDLLFELGVVVDHDGEHRFSGDDTVFSAHALGSGRRPRASAEVQWSVVAEPFDFQPPGQEPFQFGPLRDPQGAPRTGTNASGEAFEGTTDAAGHHHLGVTFESLRAYRARRVTAAATVTDPRGVSSTASSVVVVHPAEALVGIRAPSAVVEPGEPVVAEVRVVDVHGHALAGVPVSMTLERRASDGEDWAPVVGAVCAAISAASEVSCSLGAQPGGRYRVTASVRDERNRESIAELAVRVAGDESGVETGVVLFARQGPAAPGDEAAIAVVSPFHPASGLLTVRAADLVLVLPFEQRGPVETLTLPIEEDHVPDLLVRVDLVEGAPAAGVARRASGEFVLDVPPASQNLDVVAMPREREVLPGGETALQLAVMDDEGEPVMGAELAVVAAMQGRVPCPGLPDPRRSFYSRHRAAEEVSGAPERCHDTARLFAPSVFTDASGTARVPLQLPALPARVRVDVVAAMGDGRFGAARTEVVAREALEVVPGLPPVLGHGDEFQLPIELENRTGEGMSVEIALRSDRLALGDDETSSAGVLVTLPAASRSVVRLPCTSLSPGEALLQVVATSGSLRVVQEARSRVREPADTQIEALHGEIVTGHAALPVRVPADAVPTDGGLDVTVSVNPLQQLTDALAAVTATPPIGSEALASRVLAVAALREELWSFGARGMPAPADLDQGVLDDLVHLLRLQGSDGGFPVYERGGAQHPFFGIHAAHALAVARDHGYHVSWSDWTASQRYLRQLELHLPQWISRESRWALRAYALNVLYRMGDGDVESARVLLREAGTEKLPLEAHAWLLPVLHDADAEWEVGEILAHLESRASVTETRAHFATGYSDGAQVLLHSDVRANAVILDALAEVAPGGDLTAKLARGLLEDRQGGAWTSTQENAFAMLASIRFIRAQEGPPPDLLGRVWIGEQLAGEHVFRGRVTDRVDVRVPMSTLADLDGDLPLTMARKGRGTLHYRAAVRYVPVGSTSAPVDAGLAVHRTYEPVDDLADVRLADDGTWHIREGARVRVQLTLAAPVQRYHVVLDDRLPAGLELLHPESSVEDTEPPAAADEEQIERYWWWWRPWYDHEVVEPDGVRAYSAQLWEGVHTYTYLAQATTAGAFEAPPSRAEERYATTTFGLSAGERVVVE
jgi:alpha-2-macroglobulin